MARHNLVRQAWAKSRIFNFFRFFWDTISPYPLQLNWHISVLCDELQTVLMTALQNLPKENDLIVNISPGSSKSSIISITAPAWCWTIDPTFTMLCVSNTAKLSEEFARKTQALMDSQKYHDIFPEIVLDRRTLHDMTTTREGHRLSTSTESKFVGRHAKVHFYDDVMSADQARSEADRKNVNDFLEVQLPSRVYEPKKLLRVYVMQRLINDDPTDRRLAQASIDPVRLVCLPSELRKNVQPRIYRKFYENGLFDRVRFDEETLTKLRSQPNYFAHYLQDPQAGGGGMKAISAIAPRQPRWTRSASSSGQRGR